MKYDICHVYPITSGTAGTYIDEIYKSLNDDLNRKFLLITITLMIMGKSIFINFQI